MLIFWLSPSEWSLLRWLSDGLLVARGLDFWGGGIGPKTTPGLLCSPTPEGCGADCLCVPIRHVCACRNWRAKAVSPPLSDMLLGQGTDIGFLRDEIGTLGALMSGVLVWPPSAPLGSPESEGATCTPSVGLPGRISRARPWTAALPTPQGRGQRRLFGRRPASAHRLPAAVAYGLTRREAACPS